MVSFFAKKARGMLARFAIKNRLTEPAQLTDLTMVGTFLVRKTQLKTCVYATLSVLRIRFVRGI